MSRRIGVLFKPDMMRALLREEAPKRQTRRLHLLGHEGDVIVAREAWRAPLAYELTKPRDIPPGTPVHYEADGGGNLPRLHAGKLRPSMFMPAWASRAEFVITRVWREPLQSITEADAKAEGADALCWNGEPLPGWLSFPLKEDRNPFRNGFALLWCAINGDDAWQKNPEVFAHEFRRCK